MANKKSSKKAIKKSEARRIRNKSRKSMVKTFISHCTKSLEKNEASLEIIKPLFKKAQSAIQRASTKGVIHKNTAARKISKLAKKIGKKFTTFFS